jgi:hypothetical protein
MQGDAPIADANPDGTDSDVSCLASTFQQAVLLTGIPAGTAYARNVSNLALFADEQGKIKQVTAPGQTPLDVSFLASPAMPVANPSLAASTDGGNAQAFFLQETTLVKATRNSGAVWSTPIPVGTTGVSIDVSFAFGQATATIPRRAFASGGGKIYEAVEQAGGSWAFDMTTITGAIQPFHPNLSRDGLAVVFVGRDANTNLRLFVATRPSIGATFANPIALPDQPAGVGGTEGFPSFSHDCAHIYLSTDQTVIDVF